MTPNELEKTLHRAALVDGMGEIFQPGREIDESTKKLENVEVTRRTTKLAEGGEGRKGTRPQLGGEVTECERETYQGVGGHGCSL